MVDGRHSLHRPLADELRAIEAIEARIGKSLKKVARAFGGEVLTHDRDSDTI